MKKAILILGTAFILAGCNEPQGSSSDSYSTSAGSTNAPSSRSSSINTNSVPSVTDTNQTPKSTP